MSHTQSPTLTSRVKNHQKVHKVSTTIRIDPELKTWAKQYVHTTGTDLSSYISDMLVQVRSTYTTSNPTSTYEQCKTAHAAELDAMIGRIERGEEETYGPFEGEEIGKFLKSFY